MSQFFLLCAALNGFLAVALGAFGAHALKAFLSAAMLDLYQTGVHYQMFHITGLLAVHLLARERGMTFGLRLIGYLFLAGIVLFSGSLYLLALTGLSWPGMITPLGGLAFLAGWLLLARACYTHDRYK